MTANHFSMGSRTNFLKAVDLFYGLFKNAVSNTDNIVPRGRIGGEY
jgi:hypothetical protein